MKNTKAEKQLKAEKTIDLILRYIKENNLQPGDRLPSELSLIHISEPTRRS